MSCEESLRNLLEPLGVYRWEGSFQWAELRCAGAALDAVAAALAHVQREMLPLTAEDEGLQALCSLLRRDYGDREREDLRAILTAILRIPGGILTPGAAADALKGCGIPAELEEGTDGLHGTIYFPSITRPPEDWPLIWGFLETVLPCHLDLQYRFRSITWQSLEESYPSWTALEAGVARWDELG